MLVVHAVGISLLLCLIFGGVLGLAAVVLQVQGNSLVDQINDLLPQTQCGQCGYPGCKPYAEAIASGTPINRCPPGGQETIDNLASLLDIESQSLDSSFGEAELPQVALIREQECIGCTKCIQACPVDAIVGAPRLMHTVLTNWCTGCRLCVAPCPVDCIDMVLVPETLENWCWPKPGISQNPNVSVKSSL